MLFIVGRGSKVGIAKVVVFLYESFMRRSIIADAFIILPITPANGLAPTALNSETTSTPPARIACAPSSRRSMGHRKYSLG